jgi:putative redox protein
VSEQPGEEAQLVARAAAPVLSSPKPNGGGNSNRATGEAVTLAAPDQPRLGAFLARANYSAASGSGRHAIVLVHGFPLPGMGEAAPSYGYPQLAVRLAGETGAAVLSVDLRGTGESEGDFSLHGWRADLGRGVSHVRQLAGVEKVWLVGFAAGASLAIWVAAADPSIAGVAAFAPPSEFVDRGTDPRRLLAQARASGLVRSRDFPPDVHAWYREMRDARPAQTVASIPPRPLLIVHGSNDQVVPLADSRELAEAAGSTAELRVVGGAGHMLLHDPRAIALLLGWFDRHLGAQP